jgi:hypothetical protein
VSIFAVLLLALLPAASIHGTVRAEGSGAPIARATVQIPELQRSVTTDEQGYFVLPGAQAGRWAVRATAIGYRAHEAVVQVSASGSLRLDFDLAPEPVSLAPVEVREREGGAGVTGGAAGPGATRLDARAVKLTPALAEPDVLRALQTLPSVAAASDYSSALHIRGGLPDQSMISLDGVPLYNPYHLGGLLGAVDPDAVQSADLLAGAFPAGVGDRTAGMVEIRTREGGRDRARGTGSVGLISSRVGVDGPLPGGNGSYLFSARRTYLDAVTRAAHGLGVIGDYLPYDFSDAHLKMTHDVGPLGRLSASAYVNDEGLVYREEGENQEIDFDWGSHALGLRLWSPWSATVAGELRAALSGFGGRFDTGHYRWINQEQRLEDVLTPQFHASTSLRDLLLAGGVTWYGRRHQLRAGVQADWYRFHHQAVPTEEDLEEFLPPFRQTDTPRTLAAYLEDEWTAGSALAIRAGVRVLAAGERGTEWMPRLGLRYTPTSSLAFSFGAGRSAQVMHSLRDAETVAASVIAYDILAAVPEEMGLTVADDAVLGVEWTGRSLGLRVEAYERRFRHLPVTPVPEDPVMGWLVPGRFREGSGNARGLEVLGRYTRGERALTLAYTLARAEREVDGVRYAPRFDRRHTVDLSGYTPWGRRGQLSARLVWMSGQPYTPVVGLLRQRHASPGEPGLVDLVTAVPVMGEHNSARLPSYLRLDLGARRSFERSWFGRSTTITPYFQVLNVLNTRNALAGIPEESVVWTRDQEPYARVRLFYPPQLPVFPTFGLEWRF